MRFTCRGNIEQRCPSIPKNSDGQFWGCGGNLAHPRIVWTIELSSDSLGWREGLRMQWREKVTPTGVTSGNLCTSCWLLTELLNKQTIRDGQWTRHELSEYKKVKRMNQRNPNPATFQKPVWTEKTGNTSRGNRGSMTVRVFFSIPSSQVPWLDFERIEGFASKSSWNEGIRSWGTRKF